VEGLRADEDRCRQHVENATAVVTALVEELGYAAATELVKDAETTGASLRALAAERGLLTGEAFDELIAPERVTRLGSPPPRKEEP
jgi:aspartate ammonia-lyase